MAKMNSNVDTSNEHKICQDKLENLLNLGWERRTIMDEPRLSELVELYKSLNLDIHLEPLSAELLEILGEACESCYIGNWDNYKIIFTKSFDKE